MEDYVCHITCKGEKKGPFTLAQLKLMRADGVLTEDAFTPQEWIEMLEILDGEVRETGFWRKNPLVQIKKMVVEPGKTTYSGLQKLLICLTWIGYCIAGFFLAWGMLRSEDGVAWQSPSLWIALFFAGALTRTFVGKLIRRSLEAKRKEPSLPGLYGNYFCGWLPLVLIVGLTLWIAHSYLAKTTLVPMAIVGALCLGAGALLAMQMPVTFHKKWRSHSVVAIKAYSTPWVMLPFLVFAFLVLDYYADEIPQANKVISYAKWVVFDLDPPTVDSAEWQYSVRIGTTRRRVEKLIGKPDKVVNGQDWFDKAGLGVSYNFLNRVAKLSFINLGQSKHKAPLIVWGVSMASTLQELRVRFGLPNATVSEKNLQTCIWSKPPFRISAMIWTEDTNLEGKLFPQGSLKTLDIFMEEKKQEPQTTPAHP